MCYGSENVVVSCKHLKIHIKTPFLVFHSPASSYPAKLFTYALESQKLLDDSSIV